MKTIAHVTDAHLGEKMPDGVRLDPDQNWAAVLRDMAERGVDEIVYGGDIGERSAHDRFFRALAATGKPVKIVPGNHDVVAEVRKHYGGRVTADGLYEAVSVFSPWLTLFLDSSREEVDPAQLAWLDDQLESAREVLVFIHHPILNAATIMDERYPLKNRELVRERLFAHPFPVTLCCGHYHLADDRTERNVRQMITPAVSFQVRKEDRQTLHLEDGRFGYRLIQIGASGVRSEVVYLESAA